MTPAQRLIKDIIDSAPKDAPPVTEAMLEAGQTYIDQVDEAVGIDSSDDLDNDFLRCLYMIMRTLEDQPAASKGELKAGGKVIGIVTHIEVGAPEEAPPSPEPRPPATAEWLQELTRKGALLEDHKLLAEACRDKIEEINALFEALWNLGVDIQLYDEPQAQSRGYSPFEGISIHSLMFGGPSGRRAEPTRKYPRLKVRMTKKEKL